MPSKLLDAYGRLVDTGVLEEEVAGPALAGLRSPWWQSLANFLDPERLGSYLNELDSGNSWNYLQLCFEMEERYHHYSSVIGTRKLGVAGLPLTIEPASDDTDDVKAADLCRELLNDEIVQPFLLEEMDAVSKGFSVAEIIWETEGKSWYPRELLNRDARWFRYDLLTGQELRYYDIKDPGFGLPLEPFKFVKFEPKLRTGLPIKRGLARLALGAYMMATFTLRDWLSFTSRFGMPLRLGKYPTTATAQERSALFKAISGIGVDAAGIIPANMSIEIQAEGTRSGGDKVFLVLAEYMDKLISKVVLGQTATTEGTPGKLGAEDAQEHVREDIRTNDARQLAATIRRDLVRPIVDLNLGPRDRNHYPKVHLQEKKPEDLAQLATSLAVFIDRGLPVAQKKVLEKYGMEPPEEGEPLLHAATKGGGVEADENGAPLDGAEDQVTKSGTRVSAAKKPDAKNLHDDAEARGIKRPAGGGSQADRVFGKGKASFTLDRHGFEVATAHQQRTPLVDELVREATGGWRRTLGPLLEQVKAAVQGSKDAEECKKKLAKLSLSKDELTEAIASVTFRARAVGDAGRR